MEAVSSDATESVETFEHPLGKTLTLWNGREVKAFPACCSPLNRQGEGRYFNINCKS